MKNKIILGIILILAVISSVFTVLYYKTPSKNVGDIVAYPIFSGVTSSGVLCGNTSTQVVATSTSRQLLYISNDSLNSIFLSLGTPAVLHQGITLAASSTVVFDQTKLFAGAIYCIASANSSTTVSEAK